jgi:8-amino-7-oxononanoate synthase
MTLFSTNDYLGLSAHPEVRAAAAEAAERWGLGPRGSALVCGYTEQHEALEAELALWKDAESALLFPTGFATNVAVLTALAGNAETAIFSDASNHASIIDGCRMAARSGAQVHVYRHCDLGHLDALLAASPARRRLIVTDTLFSMDGDLAPLAGLAELKERHGAWLVVDEAHATLILGERGGGAVERAGVGDAVDVHVGTLSKAFGCQGGFAACSRDVRTWLLNEGRPYVFSTALPLPVVAAARAALRVRRDEPGIVARLDRYVETLRRATGRDGVAPIVPVVLGTEERALAAFERLLEEGLFVPAIRPPTVPPGTSRLRVTLSAAHEPEDVETLVRGLQALGVPP